MQKWLRAPSQIKLAKTEISCDTLERSALPFSTVASVLLALSCPNHMFMLNRNNQKREDV